MIQTKKAILLIFVLLLTVEAQDDISVNYRSLSYAIGGLIIFSFLFIIGLVKVIMKEYSDRFTGTDD